MGPGGKLMPTVIDVSKEEAIAALTGAAWHSPEGRCDNCDHTCGTSRQLVHCVAGGLGADWDLAGAVAAVRAAVQVVWRLHLLGHELAILDSKGSIYSFEVRMPDAARETIRAAPAFTGGSEQ
jgi:hypothetical protein